MTSLAILLGLSLSIGGTGGFLSGLFAHSLLRACFWAVLFGAVEAAIVSWNVPANAPSAPFNPIFIGIALFWAVLAWFAFGRIDTRAPRGRDHR